MKASFSEIMIIIALPWIISISEVRDWVAVVGGILSSILAVYGIIKLHKELFGKNRKQ